MEYYYPYRPALGAPHLTHVPAGVTVMSDWGDACRLAVVERMSSTSGRVHRGDRSVVYTIEIEHWERVTKPATENRHVPPCRKAKMAPGALLNLSIYSSPHPPSPTAVLP